MDRVISNLAEWTADSLMEPLTADSVPGATLEERRQLAALGGLALALGGPKVARWPEGVRVWAEQAPRPPVELVRAVRRNLSDGVDVLGPLYERIVSGRSRRRLGTFFTPPAVVDFMLDQVEASVGVPGTVIDPGAGVGAFTVAARRRWPSARVIAVDVNVVTLGLLAARSTAQRVGAVDLVLADFLAWLAEPHESLAGPMVIIGNPPYTRHQELPTKAKAEARRRAGDLVDSGLAGLSAYFLAASLCALGENDGLALLLPGTWVDARYGRPLRSRLWSETTRPIDFAAFPTDVKLFPGTRVTALVITIGPVSDGPRPMTTRSVTAEVERIRAGKKRDHSRSGAVPTKLGPWLWPRAHARVKDHVPLGDLARVRRGVATGANHFFFLTDEQRGDLPAGVTLPALKSIRHAPGDVLDARAHRAIGGRGRARWLLWLVDPQLRRAPSVRSLIALGEHEGLHLRHLTSLRDPWYLVEEVAPPSIMVAAVGKKKIRAITNLVKAVPSNSIHGIYLNSNAEMVATLTRWLNGGDGQRAMRANARRYSEGMFKLEPRDLLAVRVPKLEILAEMGQDLT